MGTEWGRRNHQTSVGSGALTAPPALIIIPAERADDDAAQREPDQSEADDLQDHHEEIDPVGDLGVIAVGAEVVVSRLVQLIGRLGLVQGAPAKAYVGDEEQKKRNGGEQGVQRDALDRLPKSIQEAYGKGREEHE